MTENEISKYVCDSAFEVHRSLGGPGLLESVYEEALEWELSQSRLKVQRQISLPITYKNYKLASPLRIDLLIAEKVIVECKATAEHHEIFEAQLLTYLRLSGIKLGLVINFGKKILKEGVQRVVNKL